MRNEEKYVTATLESVISQTNHPLEWVIVDDGSTDRSAEIVSSYSQRHPWIRLVHAENTVERRRARGGRIVDLIYYGLDNIEAADFDFIVKLDCDVSFNNRFFETILEAFRNNPRLGISSGISFALNNGVLEEEKSAPGHTLGAAKVYRRQCFADIGGLVPNMGWDGIDEIKARMNGWEAWPLRGLIVVHHRPEGAALGFLASGVERGKGSYFMGYHPVFLIARAFRRMLRPSLIPDGVGMLAGYFGAVLRGEPRMPDADFIRFVRKNQIRKLTLRRSDI
jgi:glycosyltransferase involved in cell wall biosynthesis